MHPSPQKNSKAEQARINGAKSRGPKTPAGLRRARTAALQHGAFAAASNLLPTVDEPHFAALAQTYQASWRPCNQYVADKVDDLAAFRWELNRLRAVRRHYMARLFHEVSSSLDSAQDGISLVEETELRAMESETLARFDLRIRRCNLEMSRIERDIIRVQQAHNSPGPSHNVFKTNAQEAEETHEPTAPPVAWAEETFDVALDVHQAAVLNADAQTVVLNAARYSGKTTALALRAVHSALASPGRPIACLSPNRDLERKVAELAAVIGREFPGIVHTLTPSATLVLVDDAALLPPGALDALNPAAAVIMASTPSGNSGKFYDAWHAPGGLKIAAPARRCDLLDPAFLRTAAAALSEHAYLQEFQCAFLPAPQPRCSLLSVPQ